MRIIFTTAVLVGLAFSPALADDETDTAQPARTANVTAPAKEAKATPAVKAEKAEQPFKGKNAYVKMDGKSLTWHIGNDAVERTLQFDRSEGALKTVKVKTSGAKAMASSPSEGEFQVMEGGKSRTIRLDKDWAYIWQTSGTTAQGGKMLTIHLHGVRSNQGYEAEANYEVYPGNRPYLEKSLTLINRTGGPITLTGATLDQWVMGMDEKPKPGKDGKGASPVGTFSGGKESGMMADSASQTGAVAMVAGGSVSSESGGMVQRYKGSMTVEPDGGRAYLPKTVFFTFRGNSTTASDLTGRYHAMGTAVASK